MRFQDLVAVITAASSGIGRATTEIIGSEGGVVVGVDTDKARLGEVVDGIPGNLSETGSATSWIHACATLRDTSSASSRGSAWKAGFPSLSHQVKGAGMSIRFGLRIPPCADVREVAATARAAEEAGFDVAWLPDSQFLWRDVWAAMALAATTTERIALGSCVTQFETRHATVTAAAAATIDELAPGRTILGVGTGDSAIKTLGLAPTRLSAMREQIANCRALWTGESVAFGGRVMALRATPPSGRLPIYMAATGPKALALAGEVADGVIVLAGVAPELIERSLFHIREGAARVGRDIAGLDICLGTFCHLTDDEREAARIVKPYACTLAQIGGGDALELAGIDVAVPAVIPEVYPDMGHAEDWDQACEVASRWITDDMALRYAEKFCFVGDVSHVQRRIETALRCGITSFYIRGFSSYTLPTDVLTTFGHQVIPRFRTWRE